MNGYWSSGAGFVGGNRQHGLALRVGGSPSLVSSRRLHPSRRVWIAHKIEQPAQQRDTVTAPESESGCMRSQGVGERPGRLVRRSYGVGDHVRHRLGVLIVVKKIRHDPGGSGHWQTAKRDPLPLTQWSLVETQVRLPSLPPRRQGEFVSVRGQVAETVYRRGGPVRHDALVRGALPGAHIRSELEPCRTKLKAIGGWRTGEAIHTVGHPLKDAFGCQPLQGGPRDAGKLHLAARQEAPLVLCDL